MLCCTRPLPWLVCLAQKQNLCAQLLLVSFNLQLSYHSPTQRQRQLRPNVFFLGSQRLCVCVSALYALLCESLDVSQTTHRALTGAQPIRGSMSGRSPGLDAWGERVKADGWAFGTYPVCQCPPDALTDSKTHRGLETRKRNGYLGAGVRSPRH